jgi:hypothetical protein
VPNARRSFLFPGPSSGGYITHDSCANDNRSSEAEINKLGPPPPPPKSVHGNSGKFKKGRKPLPPPRKVQKDSTDDEGESQNEQEDKLNLRHQNHNEAGKVIKKTGTSLFTQNKILKKDLSSMKMQLKSDRINRRKSNGKSYNLSGLLDEEEMPPPPPDFKDDVESGRVSGEQLQPAENQTNVFRKCQTALKTKMNRISALRFANGTLGNLRYSFARPKD